MNSVVQRGKFCLLLCERASIEPQRKKIYIDRGNFSKIGCNVIVDVHLELQKGEGAREGARGTRRMHDGERAREREKEIERDEGPEGEEDC